MGNEEQEGPEIPRAIQPLLREFSEITFEETPTDAGHPVLHRCYSMSNLPYLLHYRISLIGYEELHRQVPELLRKGQLCKSMSGYTIPALLTSKKMVLGEYELIKP